ncbi:MAG: hypothetical protein K9L64_06715, partial [Candidatus Izimaplasma sp.]|nr:hypothetical protein [Candidatus Izimaplasma bacterium]
MKNIIRFTFVITLSFLLISCSSDTTTNNNTTFSYPEDIYYEGSYTMNTNPTMPLEVVVEDTLSSIGELSFEDDEWLSKEDITIESNSL